jgi:tryptophanase
MMEPFRIRTVEPIPILTPAQRREALERAGYNVFNLRSAEVTIDLLSDSGTGATSIGQEAAAMAADEAYAGSRSWYRFVEQVSDLTGYPHILPVHQGRAAERILDTALLSPGQICVSNTHFDTTAANVARVGAEARNLPCQQAADLDSDEPFKGNIDLKALEDTLTGPDGPRVALVLMTITNNGGGGQPVSMANLQATKDLCVRHQIPLILDAARFGENAWHVRQREAGYAGFTPAEIARRAFEIADGAVVSLKKDGAGWGGGFLGLRNGELAARCEADLIATEGFSTYGGITGHDLERLAAGVREMVDAAYLQYRAEAANHLAVLAREAGVDTVRPAGLHAVYLNAGQLLSHLPRARFPGHTLACQLYLEGGVRCSELGSLYLGELDEQHQLVAPAPFELVRLALPRRVYTHSHLAHVAETLATIAARAETLTGYRIVDAPPALRHFKVRLAPHGAT